MTPGTVLRRLAICLPLLGSLSLPVFGQEDGTTSASVANVYVGAGPGVYLYHAAQNGALTLVPGSPYKTSGLAIGSNGTYFVTLGTDLLHSYKVGAGGAIGGLVATANTMDYNGSACGSMGTDGAVLDHSGQTVDVLLNTTPDSGRALCAAYQSFNLSKAGVFTFTGANVIQDELAFLYHLPTFTANDAFAYAQIGPDGNPADIDPYVYGVPLGFKRSTNGALGDLNFNTELPPAGTIGDYYSLVPAAGTSNFLALSLVQTQLPYGESGPVQLASFTVSPQGNLTTTNTAADMPSPVTPPNTMTMSPSGVLLAVAPGLQVFHFNGAAPITTYTGLLTTEPIDKIRWDNSNHLYALSESARKLFVFTVTPTSVTSAPGSPYTLPGAGANALIVSP